jgi:hypothetical protein
VKARGLVPALLLSAATALAGGPVHLPASFLAGTVPGTLRYQVVIEGAGGGDISGQLGNLSNLEVLAGPVLAQQVTWSGGAPVGVTALTWVLHARHPGPIAVGPTTVRIGDRVATTNEVSGSAFAGGRVPPGSLHPEVTVDLSSPRLLVGEPLVVRFYVESLGAADPEGWEVQASFPESWSERLPMTDVPPPPVAPDGFPRVPLGGWLVIPAQPGRLEIPPAIARAVFAPGERESSELPVRSATSRSVGVDVAPLPPPPVPFFGAVGELAFSRRVIAGELHTGDIAILELEVKGVGNLPLLELPPLQVPAGIRAFAAEERHQWRPSRHGLVGWRRWRIPLEVSRPGRFELPTVRLCTFVPGSGYAIQTLPALELAVRAGPAVLPVAVAPLPPPSRPTGVPPLAMLGAAFLAGALVVAGLAAWRARRGAPPRPAPPNGDAAGELRRLQLAVEAWTRSRFSVTVAEGAPRLVAAGCPREDADEAVALVQACERLRFAPSLADPADALANLRVRAAHLLADSPAHAVRLER